MQHNLRFQEDEDGHDHIPKNRADEKVVTCGIMVLFAHKNPKKATDRRYLLDLKTAPSVLTYRYCAF